jgi:hypothetical protein
MFEKQSHVDEYVSSGTSPTKQAPALSPEELHLWADAIEKIFNEPYPLVAQPEFHGGAR